MKKIAIVSPSVRKGRLSHRVALFFSNYLAANALAEPDLVDLAEYDFPLFDERLKRQPQPTPAMVDFASRIEQADGVIIIVPEYNGGYPASLKNVVDLLYDEWHHKPVALCSVSDGPFGGSQVITSFQFIMWKMKALVVTAQHPVTRVGSSFDENGIPADRETAEKRALNFINKLIAFIEMNRGHAG